MGYFEDAANEMRSDAPDTYGDRTKVALDNAVKTEPSQAIEQRKVAGTIGTDRGYVKRNLEKAKIFARQAEIDIPRLKKDAPKTHEWLGNQDNADVAWDDISALSKLEESSSLGEHVIAGAKESMAAMKLQGARIATGRLEELEQQLTGLPEATTTIGQGGTSAISGMPVDKLGRNLVDFSGLPIGTSSEALQASIDTIKGRQFTIDRARRNAVDTMMRLASEAADVKYSPGVQIAMEGEGFVDTASKVFDHPLDFILEVSARSAAPSLASLPTAVVGGAAAGPIGFGLGIGMGSASIDFINEFKGNLVDAGIDVENTSAVLTALENKELMDDVSNKSAIHAGFVGALDGLTGGIAGKFMAPEKLKGTIAGELVNVFAQMKTQATGGALGEAFGTLAAGKDISYPELFAEYFGEMVTAPVDIITARSTAAGRRSEALVKELKTAQVTRGHADAATTGKANLDSEVNAAKEVKLRRSDPETFRDYAEKVTGESEVSISSTDADTFFQENPQAEEQIAKANPAIYRNIRESMASGSDIHIMKSDYLTDFIDFHEQLSEKIRVDGNQFNNEEALVAADELNTSMQDKASTIIEGETDKFQASADKVFEYVSTQIQDTGRFTPEVANKDAELHRAFAIVRAKQMGVLPEQVYEEYGLQVTGGKKAQLLGKLGEKTDLNDLIYRLRTGNVPTEEQVYGRSMMQFLKSKGGVQDQGVELSARDVNKSFINKKGLALDEAALQAFEAGYIEERDIGLLLEAIDNELRGKPAYAAQYEDQKLAEVKKNLDEIQADLMRRGVPDVSGLDVKEIESLLYPDEFTDVASLFQAPISQGMSKSEIIKKYEGLTPTHAENGEDYAISNTELQEMLDKAGDGFLYRVTIPEYVADGKDRPSYEHRYKNGDVKKSISYTSNLEDAIPYAGFRSTSVDGRPVEDFIIYRVRPDSMPAHDMRLLIPSDKTEGKLTVHVHSFSDVDAGDVVFGGKELAEQVKMVYDDTDEGGFYDIQEEEVDQLLAELSDSLGFELIGEEAGYTEFGAEITAAEQPDTTAEGTGLEAGGELQQGGEPALRFFQSAQGGFTTLSEAKIEGYNIAVKEFEEAFAEDDLTTPEGIQEHNAKVEVYDALREGGLIDSQVLDDLKHPSDSLEYHLERVEDRRYWSEILDEHEGDTDIEEADLPDDIFEIAELAKGVTDDLNETGYLLPDGTWLDFSGKREGGPAGDRAEDHRQLGFDLGGAEYSDDMINFQKLGAVRVDANSGLADMEVRPTSKQLDDIEYLIERRGEGTLDMADGNRRASVEVENSSKVKGIIRRFYAGEDVGDITLLQEKRGAITFGDTQAVVSLLETADLSTFLHETGHFFLESTAKMAASPNAPQSIKDDMQLMLDFIDEKDVNVWLAKSIEERKASHEKIAEAFELYLMEGKAPSAKLQEAFNRFRAWLLDVYSRLKGSDVQLTDEVRGVFDRMLASQEEIDAVMESQGVYPAFESAEEAGMTEAKYAKYLESFADHEAEAIAEHQSKSIKDMKYLDNAMGKALKALQTEARVTRKAMYTEVADEVSRRKVFMARSFIEKGTLPDGIPEGIKAEKLNRKDLEEMTGDINFWKQLPRGSTVSRGGVHADVTASLFGYNNGLEMVNDIIQAGRMTDEISDVVDRRLLERYGDMYSDEQIKEAAMSAVQSKSRARIIATELNALNKRAGRANVPLSAAKAYAQTVIARLKVTAAIKFNPYLQAERRAGKEAETSIKKGEMGQAAVQKRSQLLQQSLYRESFAASKEVERDLRYLKRLNKKTIRQKMTAEYLDQADAILSRYDLSDVTLKSIEKKKSIIEWMEAEQKLNGVLPNIPQYIQDNLETKSYKELTMEQFRGLKDSIKEIEHFGRFKKDLLAAKKKRKVQEAASDIAASLRDNNKMDNEDRAYNPTLSEKLVDEAGGVAASLLNIEMLFRSLDGDKLGALHDNIFLPLSEAADSAMTRKAGIAKEVRSLITSLYTKKELMKFGGVGATRYTIDANTKLTKENIIAIGMNYGNIHGRDRLAYDAKRPKTSFTDAQIEKALSYLTENDVKFMNAMWAIPDKYLWDDLANLEREFHSEAPAKVKAMPFEVNGMKLTGGYYRLAYDPKMSEGAKLIEEKKSLGDFTSGSFGRVATEQGAAQARQDHLGRALRLDLNVFGEGIDEVVHDIEMRRAVIDAYRIITNPEFKESFIAAAGVNPYELLKPWLSDIAVPSKPSAGKLNWFIGKLRNNTAIVAMGASVKTAALNLTGYLQAFDANDVGVARISIEASRFASNPFEMKRMQDFVFSKSGYMPNRFRSYDRDARSNLNSMNARGALTPEGFSWFYLLGMTDKAVTIPLWTASYKRKMKDSNNNEKEAIKFADHIVRTTQGSGREMDLVALQRGGKENKELYKAFTMFYSFFSATLQRNIRNVELLKENGITDIPRFIASFFLLNVLPAVIAAALSGYGPGDDEDKAAWAVAETVKFMFGQVPFVRDFAGIAVDKVSGQYTFPYRVSPVADAPVQIFNGITDVLSDIANDELDEKTLKKAILTSGYAFGLPSRQVWRTTEHLIHVESGESEFSPIDLLMGEKFKK